MKATLLSLVILLSVSIFYGCKKELDVTLTENKSESNTTSSIKFIYHNQTASLSDFDVNNPDLVMAVEANNMVYIFDNENDFMSWAQTTTYADDIIALENKRQEILMNIETKSVSNKTDLVCMLYELQNASKEGISKIIVAGWPYSSLGSMDNKSSSINGASVVACYDKTNFSGSRVYVLCAGSVINFADIGFDNRTSSVLSL